jgi:hypothetical protein
MGCFFSFKKVSFQINFKSEIKKFKFRYKFQVQIKKIQPSIFINLDLEPSTQNPINSSQLLLITYLMHQAVKT